ncbi:hypothetical protein BRYFOR_09599 [Marvinbryantia formatexigens DSM 14469]|uniref:Uncharacterized protein n=1 Tax=Marvinbryantia formatexigens DSM 14469 TaxID=478749 RepID=C6LLQ1_9FIRM|nr:hypothetical protein BRYFOR_09599 [Marvinbryantia formatexigens DSM 14469]
MSIPACGTERSANTYIKSKKDGTAISRVGIGGKKHSFLMDLKIFCKSILHLT